MNYAHNMPGFMTYREIALIYASLDDETAGKVIKAVCDFFCFGIETDKFEGRALHIYETMISSISKDQTSYKSRCIANAENGKKGGRPRKTKTQQKPNKNRMGLCSLTQSKPKQNPRKS